MAKVAQLDLGLGRVFREASAPRLPLDEWAPKFRRIVKGPRPGRWKNATVPMCIEPMQAASDRRNDSVTVCAPAQLLKSEFCINVTLHRSSYGEDALFYEPDLPLLKEFMGDKIRPAAYALGDVVVEGLESKFLKKRDSVIAIRYAGGGTILGLSPEMKTGKSSHSAPLVVIDELDKMGDPTMSTTARSRTAAYGRDRMVVKVSTPTLDEPGLIWPEWLAGSMGEWRGLCPHCNELAPVGWGNVNFRTDDDGYWIARWGDGPEDCAALVCDGCGSRWSEADRQKALRAGQYVHARPDSPDKSFYVPGMAHLWFTIEEMVAEGAAKHRAALEQGEWADYQQWVNERRAEVWTDELRGMSVRGLQRSTYSLGARGEDDLGELDPRVLLVTAGSDVHERNIKTEFCAWGIDPDTMQVTCWGLRYRTIGGGPEDLIEDPELWRAYERLIDTSVWRHPGYGGAFGAKRILIDAGYRPDLVREWCQLKYVQQLEEQGVTTVHPYAARILPVKSKARESGSHPVDLALGLQGMKRPKPGLQYPFLVNVESMQVKDMVYEAGVQDSRAAEGKGRRNIWPANREAWGYDDQWFREFANEVKTMKRTPRGAITTQWEVKHGLGRANHALDTRVYATAAALVEAWPKSLQQHLLERAVRHETAWSPAELARLKRALAEIRGGGYDNAP